MEKQTFEFAQSVYDQVLRNVPAEKAASVIRQEHRAKALAAMGVQKTRDGLGQMIGSIDSRTYMRWHQMAPGCWSDPAFVRGFLKDNPQCRAPGYTPGHGHKGTRIA